MHQNFRYVLLGAALAVGCAGKEGENDTTTTTSDETTSASGTSSTTVNPTTTGATSGVDTGVVDTGDTGSADTGEIMFIENPDGGGVEIECDIWAQDCPEGEKCMPWANDGGSSWNATKCSPLNPNPAQPGDECMVEGGGVSGVDNCDTSAMCYYVDPDTNIGTCISFCEGSAAAPVCDPGFICSIVNNGVLILCRPTCDPLLQDCGDSQACLPATGSDGFTCIIDASGEAGIVGDPCEYLNSCDPGLFCAAAEAVPGCMSSQGCCSEFCDLDEADPNASCSLAGQGQECLSWFEEGTAPPDWDHVGACLLP